MSRSIGLHYIIRRYITTKLYIMHYGYVIQETYMHFFQVYIHIMYYNRYLDLCCFIRYRHRDAQILQARNRIGLGPRPRPRCYSVSLPPPPRPPPPHFSTFHRNRHILTNPKCENNVRVYMVSHV